MLFSVQWKWNIVSRLSFDQVWDLELQEIAAVSKNGGMKNVSVFKVAGQKRVIIIAEVESAEKSDQLVMGALPLREYVEFETIWPIRSYDGFLEDCRTRFGSARPEQPG
jgi:hypothetical protein